MDTYILSFMSILSVGFYSFKINLILNYYTVTEVITEVSKKKQVFTEEQKRRKPLISQGLSSPWSIGDSNS